MFLMFLWTRTIWRTRPAYEPIRTTIGTIKHINNTTLQYVRSNGKTGLFKVFIGCPIDQSDGVEMKTALRQKFRKSELSTQPKALKGLKQNVRF